MGARMFEVYLSDKHHLLVIKKGFPIPVIVGQRKWRKSKKKVNRVSAEITSALQRQGYYLRKLSEISPRVD